MLRKRYQDATPIDRYIDATDKNHDLWTAVRRRARVPAELLERVVRLGGKWHLLALSEDWCGDAVNTLPVIAALAEQAPNLELRVLGRDDNPDLMDAHLTNGTRGIPVVMVLDEEFREHGWWGPRPAELQAWVLAEGLRMPSDERYREIRRWYARDGGRTTLEQIVALLEEAAEAKRSAA